MLHDTEVKLTRLKTLYEQWFQGIERLEPRVLRKDVDRTFRKLIKEQPHNTALRFRFNSLRQRYVTLTTQWKRIGRQIEEGTYRRDVMKNRRRRQEQRAKRRQRRTSSYVPAPPPEENLDLRAVDDSEMEAALAALSFENTAPKIEKRPSLSPFGGRKFTKPPSDPRGAPPKPPPPPRPKQRPAARPQTKSGIDETRVKKIYQDYIAARKKNNESTKVDYEKMSRSIQKMIPKLKKKHAGKDIDFKVVVKDGKVGLKPIAKK